MKKRLYHYYPDSKPDSDMTTACGLNGRRTGSFIAFFFQSVKQDERCKICNKRYEKDQKILENKA